jgi:hypothetical protein
MGKGSSDDAHFLLVHNQATLVREFEHRGLIKDGGLGTFHFWRVCRD